MSGCGCGRILSGRQLRQTPHTVLDALQARADEGGGVASVGGRGLWYGVGGRLTELLESSENLWQEGGKR